MSHLQDEPNQVMKINLWIRLVSVYIFYWYIHGLFDILFEIDAVSLFLILNKSITKHINVCQYLMSQIHVFITIKKGLCPTYKYIARLILLKKIRSYNLLKNLQELIFWSCLSYLLREALFMKLSCTKQKIRRLFCCWYFP